MANPLNITNINYPRLGISIAIFVLAIAYPVYKYFAAQAMFPEYQAFPLVIAAILAILYFRLKESTPIDDSVSGTKRKYTIWTIVILSVLLSLGLILAIEIRSFRLAIIILTGFLGVLTLTSTLYYRIPGIWSVWALTLLLTIRLSRTFVSDLQLWSSWLSSQILEMFGLLHVMRGNTLSLPNRELFVDEACSGIVSLVTIISAVALYCVWMRRSFAHIFLMIVLGSLWTVLMNSIRIVTIAVALEWWDIDLSEGMPHTILGVVLFVISLGALKLIDLLLFEVFRPIDPSISDDGRRGNAGYFLMSLWDRWVVNSAPSQAELDLAYAGYGDRISSRSVAAGKKTADLESTNPDDVKSKKKNAWVSWLNSLNYLFNWPMLAILLLVCVWQTYSIWDERSTLAFMEETKSRIGLLTKDSNPLPGMELELVDFQEIKRKRDDILGEESRIWAFRTKQGNDLYVSVDFPFGPEWHELSVCYRGTGWEVSDYDVRATKTGPELWESNGFTISSNEKQNRVFFTGFGADGKPITRNTFLFNFGINRTLGDVGYYYQVQILTNASGEQLPREKADAVLEEAAKFIRDTLCSADRSAQNVAQN